MDFDDKTSSIDLSQVSLAQKSKEGGARAACLVVIAGAQAGRLFKLDRDEILIGRAADCGIRLEDEGISRHHARLSLDAGHAAVVEDLGSTNGTFCNGQRVSRHMLQDGDKVQMGRISILKFSYQDSVEEDFQRRQYEWATRDALTGCFNKKYFLERLPAEFVFAQRHNKALSLAMIDIDFFKKVNDVHGHPAGDHVLRCMGEVLQKMTRRSDVLTRYGGEEFAMMMREIPLADALAVAERIRRQVEATRIEHEGKTIPVTLSIGLGSFSGTGPGSADALLAEADGFLYRAKQRGRNLALCALNDP